MLLGEKAFEAYFKTLPEYVGMRGWGDQNAAIQHAWRAAAKAAVLEAEEMGGLEGIGVTT